MAKFRPIRVLRDDGEPRVADDKAGTNQPAPDHWERWMAHCKRIRAELDNPTAESAACEPPSRQMIVAARGGYRPGAGAKLDAGVAERDLRMIEMYNLDMPVPEIAKALGIKVSTCYGRLHRMRKLKRIV